MRLTIGRRIAAALFTASLLIPTLTAGEPVTIVDTGEPRAGLLLGAGVIFGDPLFYDWFAGEFDVTSPMTITRVEGFIYTETGASAWIKLYDDGGGVPGDQLFAADLPLPPTTPYAWTGADVSWSVSPGTYWVGFGVAQDAHDRAYIRVSYPPRPLSNEAAYRSSSGAWLEVDDLGLGLHVLAETTPVPEPASLLLVGAGVVGLAACRRRLRLVPRGRGR